MMILPAIFDAPILPAIAYRPEKPRVTLLV